MLRKRPEHINDINITADNDFFTMLSEDQLVVISSVYFGSVEGYDGVRFEASLKASRAYREAEIPQIVMVDPRSHKSVRPEFEATGALVGSTVRPGHATPYIDAAWLARWFSGPEVRVIKAEADKLLTARTIGKFEYLLNEYAVLVGKRSRASMESMSPIQERTEGVMDSTLSLILPGVPEGVTSGVQGYSPVGLEYLFKYEEHLEWLGNLWLYLLTCPFEAHKDGLLVGNVEVDIEYDQAMVAAEATLSTTLKRLEQNLVMPEGALKIAAAFLDASPHILKEQRLGMAADMLGSLRQAVAPSS